MQRYKGSWLVGMLVLGGLALGLATSDFKLRVSQHVAIEGDNGTAADAGLNATSGDSASTDSTKDGTSNGDAVRSVQAHDSLPKGRALYDRVREPVEPSAEELVQLQQRLAEITAISSQKSKHLDSLMVESIEEAHALRRAELAAAIELWRSAWEKGNVEAYLSSYVADYRGEGFASAEEWRQARRRSLTQAGKIRVSLSEFTQRCNAPSEIKPIRCQIQFTQEYHSPNYADTVRKVLTLVPRQSRYKIESEAILE